MKCEWIEVEPGVFSLIVDGVVHEARLDAGTVTIAAQRYKIERPDPRKYVPNRRGSSRGGHNAITAPMPGKIVRLLVSVGDEVAAGQGIAVIEAMKMQNELKSSTAGRVTSIAVKENDAVVAGATLAVIE